MARQKAKALFYVLLFILIGWPIVQMYQVYVAKPEQENATVLLHQVSMFQLQLLQSVTTEAAGAGSTGSLNSLQQAAYTMQFVHQRLELAAGKGKVAGLEALADFQQYLLSLQITGNRALRPEETQVLERMNKFVGSLQPIYGRLITDEGKVSKPANEELAQADEAMRQFLQEVLLE
ncbi:hypothetical protein XYCOK13_30260 [Xylanibacillus composti]|uniref:S-adenosylmethionine decarboxylase n=1 Tax=Xylanibacillus composti TaxID=1572762 RepID=A0A8J4H3B1_9BACL|nr:hypothetical protein [Xylanibacillus composti]GIQ70202.1 hypothetical protein XYCOK13_30260 [Xylanibacillus composti]